MNLQQVREKFVRLSGRYDLVSDRTPGSFVDNGANYFIKAGQRLLDGLQPSAKHIMRFQVDKIAGTGVLEVKYIKAIYHVWAYDPTESGNRYELERVDYNWLKKEYNEPLINLDTNSPRYYAPVPIALAPSQRALKTTDYSTTFTYGYEDILFANEGVHWEYTGILVRPSLDTTYMFEVEGLFASVLETDADYSYWTVEHEDLAIEAAMLAMEVPYRNSQGFNDLLLPLRLKLDGIDKDSATEITEHCKEMQG